MKHNGWGHGNIIYESTTFKTEENYVKTQQDIKYFQQGKVTF